MKKYMNIFYVLRSATAEPDDTEEEHGACGGEPPSVNMEEHQYHMTYEQLAAKNDVSDDKASSLKFQCGN
jgi:hypothetical protein